MPQPALHEFVSKLHTDRAFRARFARDPAAVLREHGFDPDLLDLPTRIDLAELEQRLAAADREHPRWTIPTADEATRLSADELWQRFHFIRTLNDPAAIVTTTITGVIYGTTAATTVTVATEGVAGPRPQSMPQITKLRELSRLPIDDLRFSVSGPDGLVVSDLSADVVKALLGRVQPGHR